jgi:hypothetical protein
MFISGLLILNRIFFGMIPSDEYYNSFGIPDSNTCMPYNRIRIRNKRSHGKCLNPIFSNNYIAAKNHINELI